jgi:lipoprotein signal peptidase
VPKNIPDFAILNFADVAIEAGSMEISFEGQ